MADIPQLSRLTRRADSVAESASALVRQTMRDIRGELANLSGELNLAGNAEDREKVYAEIRRRMALLSRRMNTLMEAQNEEAAKGAAKSASALTGLEVKYSPSRAKAICELVTPAQGENLAAVFTDRMGRALINSLREATVGMLREQAIAGGSMKDMSRDLAERWSKAANMEDPKFTDASGRVWNTKTYIQMNVRTNTMRVYNDVLADTVARETGGDLMRISTGGDQDCDCAAWEGCIISLTGKTQGLPTYEDARNGGCFHPNCTHTLEYVDETVDAQEIELQKAHPVDADNADDYDAQDERKYEIDQARYMRDNPGMTQEQARVAVDRDNLAASIQGGLIREDAREIVAKMTDAQVTALCPDGNPPAFEPTKGTKRNPEPEKWNHGSNGGVVHIARNASAEHILEICKVKDAAHTSSAPTLTPPDVKDEPTEIRESITKEERKELINDLVDISPKILKEKVEQSLRMAPPYMLKLFANGISEYRVPRKGESRENAYLPSEQSVRIDPRKEETLHPVSIIHESAHAALHLKNDYRDDHTELGISDKYLPIMQTVEKEADALAKRWYPAEWERRSALEHGTLETMERCRTKMLADLGLKGVFAKQTVDVRKAIDCAMDIGASATQGQMFYGHGMNYYAKDRTLALDEIVADISAAIATKNKWVLDNYPETCAAVRKIVYGAT